MCPKVSENPKRARKGVMLSIKLDIIERFDYGKWNKDIICTLNLPASSTSTIHMPRERILRAAEITTGPASNKVVSFSQHPIMDKLESIA